MNGSARSPVTAPGRSLCDERGDAVDVERVELFDRAAPADRLVEFGKLATVDRGPAAIVIGNAPAGRRGRASSSSPASRCASSTSTRLAVRRGLVAGRPAGPPASPVEGRSTRRHAAPVARDLGPGDACAGAVDADDDRHLIGPLADTAHHAATRPRRVAPTAKPPRRADHASWRHDGAIATTP